MAQPEAVAVVGEIVTGKVGEDRCDCGWKLPVNTHANVKLRNIAVSYNCPECGAGFVMERDPMKDR